MLVEGNLQRVQLVPLGQPFHGRDASAICLDRQHETRFDRVTIEVNRTRATDPFERASNMSAGEPRFVSYEVNQQHSDWNSPAVCNSVYRDRNFCFHSSPPSARSKAMVTTSRLS